MSEQSDSASRERAHAALFAAFDEAWRQFVGSPTAENLLVSARALERVGRVLGIPMTLKACARCNGLAFPIPDDGPLPPFYAHLSTGLVTCEDGGDILVREP